MQSLSWVGHTSICFARSHWTRSPWGGSFRFDTWILGYSYSTGAMLELKPWEPPSLGCTFKELTSPRRVLRSPEESSRQHEPTWDNHPSQQVLLRLFGALPRCSGSSKSCEIYGDLTGLISCTEVMPKRSRHPTSLSTCWKLRFRHPHFKQPSAVP